MFYFSWSNESLLIVQKKCFKKYYQRLNVAIYDWWCLRYAIIFLKEHGKEIYNEVRAAYVDTMNKVNFHQKLYLSIFFSFFSFQKYDFLEMWFSNICLSWWASDPSQLDMRFYNIYFHEIEYKKLKLKTPNLVRG